jgi:hypothetical protein
MIFAFVLDQGTIAFELGFYISNRKRRFPINLLRVCRQIHLETALLPYKLNKFTFSDLEPKYYIERFLARRSQAQMEVLLEVMVDERKTCTHIERLKEHVRALFPRTRTNYDYFGC